MEYLTDFVKLAKRTRPQDLVERYDRPFLLQREKYQEHHVQARGTLMMDVSKLKEILAATEDKKQPRRFYYLSDEELVVGREEGTNICIPHLSVSKRHATLVASPHPKDEGKVTFAVVDAGSTNGTYVNDERVPPNTPHRLLDSDVIAFGSLSFSYYEAPTFLKLVEDMVAKLGGRG